MKLKRIFVALAISSFLLAQGCYLFCFFKAEPKEEGIFERVLDDMISIDPSPLSETMKKHQDVNGNK